MPHALKTPLDPKKLESSAIFYRTHLGHRENAVHLAIKLIRRAVEIERQEHTPDPVMMEFISIGEPWTIDHVIQGCYIEEYHQWEKGVKQYCKAQRELNCLPGDFNWKTAVDKSFVKRATEAIEFFCASVDPEVMAAIDAMRNRVNEMKHDPLSNRVQLSDIENAFKTLTNFWEMLAGIEGLSFA
jgi:hypothetical protein